MTTLHEILTDVAAYLAAAIYFTGVATGLLIAWLATSLAKNSTREEDKDNDRD